MKVLKYIFVIIVTLFILPLTFLAIIGAYAFLEKHIGGWALPVFTFSTFIIIILILILIGILAKDLYKKPESYEYTMDDKELINLLKNNLEKNKYKLVESNGNQCTYEKDFFIGTIFGTRVTEKLILLKVNKYDDTTRERVKAEIDKCIAENKEIKKPKYRKSTQMIIIADKIEFDVDNFYESRFTFLIMAGRFGDMPTPYGILIPFVIDKENKRIIISGFITKDGTNFIPFDSQRNRIVRLFKNYF